MSHVKKQPGTSSEPGNGSGSLESACTIGAWTGKAPTNRAALEHEVTAGKADVVVITTHAEDTGGPHADVWRETDFQQELDGTIVAASSALFHALHGGHFTTYHDGAERAIGYQGVQHDQRKAIGIWSSSSRYAFIVIDVAESKTGPASRHANALAAVAVPTFMSSAS